MGWSGRAPTPLRGSWRGLPTQGARHATETQQHNRCDRDRQALHRVRERLVRQRIGVINQIRAFLLERGVAVRQGFRFLRAELPSILAKRTDVLSPRMSHILEDLAGDSRPLDDSPARSKAWLGKTRGCITTCWQLRSPTSSLDRLGNSQQRARVRIYEDLCGGARCLTLTYPRVETKKRPAGTNKETATSGQSALHQNSVVRSPHWRWRVRGRQFGRFNSPSYQQLCMHTPCENRQPERLLQCRTSDLETLCTDNCGSLPYGKLLDAL
jgi:hypothetical protein